MVNIKKITPDDWIRLKNFANLMKRVTINPKTQCWIYTSNPQLRYNGKLTPVSRAMYQIFYVNPEIGKNHVRHLCSNDSATKHVCINPEHLILGNHKDNMKDKIYPPVLRMIERLEELGYTISS